MWRSRAGPAGTAGGEPGGVAVAGLGPGDLADDEPLGRDRNRPSVGPERGQSAPRGRGPVMRETPAPSGVTGGRTSGQTAHRLATARRKLPDLVPGGSGFSLIKMTRPRSRPAAHASRNCTRSAPSARCGASTAPTGIIRVGRLLSTGNARSRLWWPRRAKPRMDWVFYLMLSKASRPRAQDRATWSRS